MKKILLFSLLATVVGLSACKEDPEEGTLVVTFKPTYEDLPLATFSDKPFDNGQQVQLTHISLFVADLELLNGSSARHLDDVELMDLSFDQIAGAQEGYEMRFENVPAGNYTGIRFGIGVPPDLNQMEPADFPSSHPLSNTGYYWVAWSSYIFSKTEGRLDTLGTGVFDMLFSFHTGSDELYAPLEAGNITIAINDGEETNLEIWVDYREILRGIDIKSDPQNHDPNDTVQINKIVENLVDALTLVQ